MSPAGRPRLYDLSHFEKVAQVYNDAAMCASPPRKAVAERFSVPESTAAKWVSRAREEGFLPPTEQGRRTWPTDHFPVRVEMHRATPAYRHWYACNTCLTSWPCDSASEER